MTLLQGNERREQRSRALGHCLWISVHDGSCCLDLAGQLRKHNSATRAKFSKGQLAAPQIQQPGRGKAGPWSPRKPPWHGHNDCCDPLC